MVSARVNVRRFARTGLDSASATIWSLVRSVGLSGHEGTRYSKRASSSGRTLSLLSKPFALHSIKPRTPDHFASSYRMSSDLRFADGDVSERSRKDVSHHCSATGSKNAKRSSPIHVFVVQ